MIVIVIIAFMLTPLHRAKVKQVSPTLRTVRVWSKETVPAFQDCFDITQWDIFKEAAGIY